MSKNDVYKMGHDDGVIVFNGGEPDDRWNVPDDLLETYCDGYEDGTKGLPPTPR